MLAAAGGPRALTHGSHILDHDDDEDFDLHEQRVLEDLRCCAQRKMEAFAGGLHPRLGHDSVVLSLREHALLPCLLLLRGHALQCLLLCKGHAPLLRLPSGRGHALLQCLPLHKVRVLLLCPLL